MSGCAPTPRNIVLVTIDTLRADHVSAYGGTTPTPHLDRVAAEGTALIDAFTPTPSTGPAHVSLMTGLYPWSHGVLLNAVEVRESDPMLPEILQAAGFTTAAFVSSYNVDERWGFGRGFDHFHFSPNEERRSRGKIIRFSNRGAETTDAALSWLRVRAADRFFLWIHYFDPHAPYDPPPAYHRPETEGIDLTHKPYPAEKKAGLTALIRSYRGEVAYTDAQIGRLLAELEELELLEQTHLIITADHGEGLGDHGHIGHGWNLHDELVRVPLLVRSPDLPPRGRLRGHAQLEDLMPTILSLAGVPSPPGMDGLDLMAWLRDDSEVSPRPHVLGRRAAFSKEPSLFYVLDGTRKWIGTSTGRGTAYRMDRDPRELEPVTVDQLPMALAAAAEASRQPAGERILDDEARRALEALGYL